MTRAVEIDPQEDAGMLTERLASVGAELLIETLRAIERGDCPRIKQNEEEATYYPLLKKETGVMDLGQTAVHLANQVRGLSPRPGAYIGEYKILWAEPEEWEGTETAGTILKADPKQGLLVRAGEGALRIVRLQAPGGKVMDARDYLRGHRMEAGTLIVPERVDG